MSISSELDEGVNVRTIGNRPLLAAVNVELVTGELSDANVLNVLVSRAFTSSVPVSAEEPSEAIDPAKPSNPVVESG